MQRVLCTLARTAPAPAPAPAPSRLCVLATLQLQCVVTSRGRIGESKRTGGGAVWWDGIPRFLRARGPAAAVRPGAVQFCRRAGAEIIAGCRWPPNASRLATTEGMERKARRRPQAINRHRRATAAVRGTTSKWGSGRAERLVAAACAPIHVSPQWSEVK